VHEGISMSVLEAIVRGIPMTAPKVGSFEEIICDSVQGYLVESRNPKEFAERCVTAYENDLMRHQMGSAAREKIVQNLSMERMA
jgi:glycosyltransferase involved in cell wall biosynthesis